MELLIWKTIADGSLRAITKDNKYQFTVYKRNGSWVAEYDFPVWNHFFSVWDVEEGGRVASSVSFHDKWEFDAAHVATKACQDYINNLNERSLNDKPN